MKMNSKIENSVPDHFMTQVVNESSSNSQSSNRKKKDDPAKATRVLFIFNELTYFAIQEKNFATPKY